MAKSGRLELRDNIYGYYKFTLYHCDVSASKAIQFGEKRKKAISRSRSLKVIDVGTNRKHVYDFLLVINNN